ncbi:MAG: hypothetical protein RR705_00155 [Lachnospiraceae bacterium]
MQGLSQREKLTDFLNWLVTAINHTFFFLTSGEAGIVSRKLSEKEREQFFNNLIKQQKELLSALSIHLSEADVRVFGNLLINLFMVCSSREKDHCYYEASYDDMINQLVRGIIEFVDSRK